MAKPAYTEIATHEEYYISTFYIVLYQAIVIRRVGRRARAGRDAPRAAHARELHVATRTVATIRAAPRAGGGHAPEVVAAELQLLHPTQGCARGCAVRWGGVQLRGERLAGWLEVCGGRW